MGFALLILVPEHLNGEGGGGSLNDIHIFIIEYHLIVFFFFKIIVI